MPTPTYELIESVTLTSAVSSVTLSAIPQSFRDLVLVVNGTVGAAALVQLTFNSDTGANYSYVRAIGYSSGAVSDTGTSTSTYLATVIGTAQSVATLSLMDYSATDKHKTVLARSMSGVVEVWMGAARWANTAAITNIRVGLNTSSYQTGTTFKIFGIAG